MVYYQVYIHIDLIHPKNQLYRNRARNENENKNKSDSRYSTNINKCFIDFIYEKLKENTTITQNYEDNDINIDINNNKSI